MDKSYIDSSSYQKPKTYHLNGALEAGELHHRVRDLAHPQRRQSFVEAVETFGSGNLLGTA